MLKRVQAGINRLRLGRGPPTRLRLPVTPHLLTQMRNSLNKSSHPAKSLIWAAATTAFFGFFRLGELLCNSAQEFSEATCLAWGDVAVDNQSAPTMVQIHLKKSKCDQFGAGADVVVGATGDALCPVSALLDYLKQRGSSKGPFFQNQDGRAVVKAWFVEQFRLILANIGAPHHQYAGHSFRIGAATTAARAGVEDSTIQALGRWYSATFLQYIRIPKEDLARVSATLAKHRRLGTDAGKLY